MKKDLIVQLHSSFEQCMQTETEGGTNFWLARDLQVLLGYAHWRNFEPVIEKAKTACANSGHEVADHFARARKMVPGIVSGGLAGDDDVFVHRQALCYVVLISYGSCLKTMPSRARRWGERREASPKMMRGWSSPSG